MRADQKRKIPELLAPAGDPERLRMAVLYGADAVYLAGTDFGMRAFAGNFTPEQMREAVEFAHSHGDDSKGKPSENCEGGELSLIHI